MISFRSKITIKVLDYFFMNPEKRHYINEFAKMFSLDPKNVDVKLKELEKEGILHSEFMGKQKYFYLNKSFPLLASYKEIFSKTVGVEKRLKDIFEKNKKITEAYIFGSYAKDKMDANSDIDILVVGEHSSIELQKEILDFQRELDREINILDFSEKEFEEKKKNNDPLIKNIFNGKTIKIK